MYVTIDPHAGFCFGVEKAVAKAEAALAAPGTLFCLGEIVHNEEETARLRRLGMQVIGQDEYRSLSDATVLIRAHGEPPGTYAHARNHNITLIEATCPVVLKLQERVRKAWMEMKAAGGTVIIAGRKGHPEVIGLLGQTDFEAVIVQSATDLANVDYSKPIRLFAQTTFSGDAFREIRKEVRAMILRHGGQPDTFSSVNSICGQVSGRESKLRTFCRSHDVIIFVSGRHSSNGKNLFRICLEANPDSHHISAPSELDSAWTINAKSVGISGATSTPRWLMEQTAKQIEEQNTRCS